MKKQYYTKKKGVDIWSRKKPLLSRLSMDLTERCNNNCIHCCINLPSDHSVAEQKELSTNEIKDIISDAASLGCLTVRFTGGEPLIYLEDVLQIAEESKKLNVPMIVVTNGVLITECFLKIFAKLGHTLVISLDTMDQSKWQSFRGKNHYSLVMSNIRLARSLLGNRLRIQSVLAKETIDDIPIVQSFCNEHSIPHVIQPYMDFGGSWHSAGKAKDNGVACAARKNICIYPNGDVVKCFDHYRIHLARDPLGNITDEDIVTILCKKRSTEVSKIMKTCNYPCKQLSCNIPTAIYNP